MLAIRLSRTGSKKQAHYRLVVCETKQATEGRFVEIVGHYNPRTVPATVTVNVVEPLPPSLSVTDTVTV